MIRENERIIFGTYPTEADGTVKPVIWKVLDVKDNKALIITEKGIDAAPYNKHPQYDGWYHKVTWESCTLRGYINGEMLECLFTDNEKKLVCETKVENNDNKKYGTPGGAPTKDRLFLLNTDEAERYFASPEARQCMATDFVKAKATAVYNDNCCWALRTPGWIDSEADPGRVSYVDHSGKVNNFGRRDNYGLSCVRPACWIDISKPESENLISVIGETEPEDNHD